MGLGYVATFYAQNYSMSCLSEGTAKLPLMKFSCYL